MVRTVRRTLLRSQLACNEMQASVQTCGRRAAQHDQKYRLKSTQYTFIIPHRVIQLTTISFWVLRDKAAPSTSQHKSTNKQIPFEASEEPSDTVIHFYFCFFSIYRRALLSANQWQWSSNRANVPRICWAKVFGPRILRRILPNRFAKKSWPN